MRQWMKWLGACLALLSPGMLIGASDDLGGMGSSDPNFGSSSSRSSRSRSRSSSSNSFESNSDTSNDFGGSSRSEGRSSRRDRNNRNGTGSSTKATGTPGPGSKATPGAGGKELKTATGKKPTSSGKGSSGGEGRPVTDVEFKMKANPDTNLLYIEGMGAEPTMNILAMEGQEFVTRVFYVNPRGTTYKTFTIALKFDPGIIQPAGIDDSDIASQLEGDSSAHVDTNRGVLTFKGTLKEPRTDPTMTVFKVQWKALTPASDAAISFINNDKFRSNVLNEKDQNVLLQRDENGEVEASAKAGLVDAAVSVTPSPKTARRLADDEGSFSAISMANNISAGTAEGGVTLELRPRRSNVSVGEDFLVDIMFSNPRSAELDTMKIKLRFDPSVLQVVDYDNENWITQGVNIYDGDYHDDLPFDYHRKNTASNSTGVIEYDMGFATRVRVPMQGTIATIRMKAVAPAGSTPIAFVYDDTPEAEAQTAVSFLGFNLVGTPGERASALRSANLVIN